MKFPRKSWETASKGKDKAINGEKEKANEIKRGDLYLWSQVRKESHKPICRTVQKAEFSMESKEIL